MDEDKKPTLRRPTPNVLKKLNTENLFFIQRSLAGELPDSLKPNYIPPGPVRGQFNEVAVSKPPGLLSACIHVKSDSPTTEKVSSDDEIVVSSSPLKKSFSFREKFSRISFLGKPKHDKHKSKATDETKISDKTHIGDESKRYNKAEHEFKSNKRFWIFRSKEMDHKASSNRPIYKRSKSFEFLPRAAEEETKEKEKGKGRNVIKSRLSFVFGSNDSLGETLTSNESTENISNVYYDHDDSVCLKSIRELPTPSADNYFNLSVANSEASNGGNNLAIFERQSVQNLLEEFNKVVDLFSEAYLSDCEPYTKSTTNTKEQSTEKRKSSSFSTIPSPKVIHVNKVSEASEDFKKELSQILNVKRASEAKCKSVRRGSLTDFFLLEDKAASRKVVMSATIPEDNKYRRAQKKPMNRVRRMSSTKYVSTIQYFFDENCSWYLTKHFLAHQSSHF